MRVLILSLAACDLKDGHDGLVNGTLGDTGALVTETEEPAPPADGAVVRQAH